METIISAPQLVLADGMCLESGIVVVDNGQVKSIDSGKVPKSSKNAKLIRFKEGIIHPGLIDLHVHGLGTCSWRNPADLSIALANRGTTSFLSTIPAMDCTPEKVAQYSRSIGGEKGARILGLYLEGPFLNPEMAGAQLKDSIQLPDVRLAKKLIKSGEGNVRIMTVAPELPGAEKIVKLLNKNGIIAAAGHSQAHYTEIIHSQGVRHITHLFNRSGVWHHREPSLTGWGLLNDDVSIELIAEPSSLHPAAIKVALRMKPQDQVVFISDSVPWDYNAKPVIKGNAVFSRDGTLQGSSWGLLPSFNWAQQVLNKDLGNLLKHVTINPAQVLNLPNKGDLKPGMDADLVLNANGQAVLTMVEGNIVYVHSSHADLAL
ncbi:MAG: N-acetylglucosamine-6-phosphate deacetylase [Candidatus Saccharibacteria bacterium]